MFQRAKIASLAVLMMISAAAPAWAGGAIAYVRAPVDGTSIIDTRSDEICSRSSLTGAICLPARDFLGRHRRLVNISGMLWLLGTAGLTGKEHVLITGNNTADKEFVAGLLYLAGQAKVSVLALPLQKAGIHEDNMEPGTSRSQIRETIFQAAMRDDRIILRSELAALAGSGREPVILDGRSDAEYWGSDIRAGRGGHIPGAQSLPLRALRPGLDKEPPIHLPASAQPVIYSHDSYEGLVYLSRLVASGLEPKLYLEGWAGWASDGALPADAASYPDRSAATPKRSQQPVSKPAIQWPLLGIALFAGAALASGGLWLAQRTYRT